MKILKKFLGKFRRLKLIYNNFTELNQLLDKMSDEMEQARKHRKALDEIVLHLVETSPGKGWVELVQNAIAQLDTRITESEKISQVCAQLLKQVFSEDGEDDLMVVYSQEDTKDIQ